MFRYFAVLRLSRIFPQKVSVTVLSLLVVVAACLIKPVCHAVAQSNASTTWAVSVVLPPKLVAGKSGTLAVLGVDGRLAEGITVTIGDTLRLKTDKTGRASFTTPSGTSVIDRK